MAGRLMVPQRAKPGDTVAIVSPSAPGVAWWPHRVARGRAYLESLGLKVRLMPNAGKGGGGAAGTPQERAADIHEAFLDERVSVVLASIGGDHSDQVLPHLDFRLIADHPKILQGYSDITVLLWAVAVRSGLRTLYGPTLTTELGEFPGVLPYTDRAMRSAWSGAAPEPFEPAAAWTDERLDLFRKVDLTRSRHMSAGSGWHAVRDGVAEGPLFGGCLDTICRHLEGSAYWPDLRGALLFLETSDEVPTPADVDAHLSGLERRGVFANAAGLVFGRPFGYTGAQKEALWAVVRTRTAASGIPVLADVDIGHTDPMLTLPMGAQARIDAGALEFALLEPATA